MLALYIVLGVIVLFVIIEAIIAFYFVDIGLHRRHSFSKKLESNISLDVSSFSKGKEWLNDKNIEEVTINSSKDNTLLAGYYLKAKKASHKYVINGHGYRGKYNETAPILKCLYDKDFNYLMFDQRGNGKSGSKYLTMGALEKYDVLDWINYIVKKDKKAEIVVYGISMGGATVMLLAGLKLPSNVKCIVEDCGYNDIYEQMSNSAKLMTKMPTCLIMPAANILCRIKLGFSLHESTKKSLKNCDIPFLFIHGDEDDFVYPYMLDKNEESLKKTTYREKYLFKGAKHALSYASDPKKYTSILVNFVDKFVE